MKFININTPYFRNINHLNNIKNNINSNIVFNTKVKNNDLVVVVDYIDQENPILNHSKNNVILWDTEIGDIRIFKNEYINQFGYFLTNKDYRYKNLKTKIIKALTPICFQTWIKDKTKISEASTSVTIKTKEISLLTTDHFFYATHPYRFRFVKYLKKIKSSIDIFGFKKLIPMEDGLFNYKYTIVLENTLAKDHWSEKLTDAMRMKCFIFYYGCENIYDYFDNRSIVKIDIKYPEQALKIIKETIKNKAFENNLEAIENNYKKATELSLTKYLTDILKKNQIEYQENRTLIYENKLEKVRTRKKIPWTALSLKQTYIYIWPKLIKYLKNKIIKKI